MATTFSGLPQKHLFPLRIIKRKRYPHGSGISKNPSGLRTMMSGADRYAQFVEQQAYVVG